MTASETKHGAFSFTLHIREHSMSSAQDETKLETPHLSASVLQHGHHFTSLVVRGSEPDAATTDALGGFADLDAYHNSVTRAFFNCIVGRYANRMPAGESRFSTGAKIQLTGTDQGQSSVPAFSSGCC
jgi:galactose mutarotase-like enzyme